MTALVPFCSVTPMQPSGSGYDPASPSSPYGVAGLFTYGGYTYYYGDNSLPSQAERDEIILKYAPAPPSEVTVRGIDDLRRYCTVEVVFRGHNVTTAQQYLALFSVQGSGTLQIFLGYDLLQTEDLSGDDKIAILMDCPGDGVHVFLFLRLASDDSAAELRFRGMDCYLL
jgi:hypothetical protein